jgi:hypothetical protein
MNKEFISVYYFLSFSYLSLGFHIDLSSPNIEIHLPFGFIRIGWVETPLDPCRSMTKDEIKKMIERSEEYLKKLKTKHDIL